MNPIDMMTKQAANIIAMENGNTTEAIKKFMADAITLALRLYNEDESTFAPETIEVMNRYRPLCKGLIEQSFE